MISRKILLFDEEGLSKFPADITEYAVSLQCANAECEFPVILLAPVPRYVAADDLANHIAKNWTTSEAACAKKFPPGHPFQLRDMLPLRRSPVLGVDS